MLTAVGRTHFGGKFDVSCVHPLALISTNHEIHYYFDFARNQVM